MTKDAGDKKPSGSRRRSPGDPATLDRGGVVGRYVILHRAGIGGMGVVYAAYDPELDRKIAVKLVLPKRGGTQARTRLLREAQAMARLSHPNVITVHDVGTFGDEVFLALEFVEGETLALWLKREHPWRRILQVFREAGRGLAAAHRAGLVHRDFNPSNVLLGADGRTRVLDFGMARPRTGGGSLELPGSPEAGEQGAGRRDLPPSPLSAPVTEEGVVIGTLPYMAPEVPLDQGTDARSDQFSFCAALYEAVYGEHPFASPGDSTLDLIDRMIKGEVKPAPPGSPVPGWLRNVLLRGLSTDPEGRYPTMDDLLAALDEGPGARRRIALAAVLALVVTVSVLVFVRSGRNAPAIPPACREGEAQIAEVWDEEARRRIETAFSATGSAFAADSWQTVEGDLGRFVSSWREQLRDACDDTHVREEQSDEVLELRLLCLDRHVAELSALVDLFSQADEQVTEESVAAVQSLDGPEDCADIERLLAAPGPEKDPRKRAALRQARARLARALALSAAGKYRDALAEGQATAEAARSLSHPDLLAEALLLTGEMHRWLGNHGPAADDLVETMWASEASRQDRVAAQAANQLVLLLGVDQRLFARAHYWVRLGQAKLDRALGDVRELQADLLDGEGVMLRVEGRYAESLDRHRRALVLRQEELTEHGENHRAELKIAATSDHLAATVGSLGRHGEAREHLERALEIRRRALGPDHPVLAGTHNNLGIELKHLGLLEEALAHQKRAEEIFEEDLGPSHRFTVFALNNIANTLNELDRHPEAQEYLERALAAIRREGDEEDADPSLLSLTLVNQAGTFQHLGRDADAVPLLRRALELDEAELGEDHPYVAEDLHELAVSLLTLDRVTEALPLLERALEILRKADDDPSKLAAVRFELARALERAGGDPERARSLARQARDFYRGDEERFRGELEDVRSWLARAGAPPQPSGS